MSIQCQTCKQTFLQTTKAPAYVFSLDLFSLPPLSIPLYLPILSPQPKVQSLLTLDFFTSSLLEHASNKHNKGLADCFPGVSA